MVRYVTYKSQAYVFAALLNLTEANQEIGIWRWHQKLLAQTCFWAKEKSYIKTASSPFIIIGSRFWLYCSYRFFLWLTKSKYTLQLAQKSNRGSGNEDMQTDYTYRKTILRGAEMSRAVIGQQHHVHRVWDALKWPSHLTLHISGYRKP